jgi:hypothetical protein
MQGPLPKNVARHSLQKVALMKLEYHRRITAEALAAEVSPTALAAIISANLGQDALRFQFGHDYYHYDNNAFEASDTYIEQQRRAAIEALACSSALPAWQAFGRLTHAAQDFYAHTNYVTLWRERHPGLPPDQILSGDLASMPGVRLYSGRLYYPLEVLSFIPFFGRAVAFLLPTDAHAHMNKDDPSRPGFELAYTAAVNRTALEFHQLLRSLPPLQEDLFRDKPAPPRSTI